MADKKDAPALVADDYPEPPPVVIRSPITERYRKQMEAAVRESEEAAAKKSAKDETKADAPAPAIASAAPAEKSAAKK